MIGCIAVEKQTHSCCYIYRIVFFYRKRDEKSDVFFLLLFNSIKFVTIMICDCDRLSPSFIVNVMFNREAVCMCMGLCMRAQNNTIQTAIFFLH